jgi:hypothetical protein
LRSRAAGAQEPADPARSLLPQPGDLLVEAGHEAEAKPLKPGDLAMQDLTLAWAFDPQKKLVRDGSRLNMILLMRFDPATLGEGQQAHRA